MPVLRFKTESGWVEVPAIKGDQGDLTVAVGDARYAPIAHDHNTDYYTKAEIDALIANITTLTHDHDDRYYTMTTLDGMFNGVASDIAGKSDIGHTHDDRYHTKEHAATVFALKTHNHDAGNITSGTLGDARIPNLSASKITSGVFSAARIPVLDAASIPNLDTSKITTGTFATTRIPTLTTGHIPTLTTSHIPNLPASKITSGTLSAARIPALTLTDLFPNNRQCVSTSRLFRTIPHNDGSVIATISVGTDFHYTGWTRTTDEGWAYVMIPNLGFGWFPTAQMGAL